MNKLVFGKDPTERIVSLEVHDQSIELFFEDTENNVTSTFVPYKNWVLGERPVELKNSSKLLGKQHYKFINEYECLNDLYFSLSNAKRNKVDYFKPGNNKECSMLRTGMTYFKGMKHTEVSLLSFDIETTSLKQDENAFIILISNTIRKGLKIERRLFSYEDYASQGEMLVDWCKWVREQNPSIILGHNIYMYDLPYMKYIADQEGVQLDLGRDSSAIRFDSWESKFRKDATMFFNYNKAHIYGREIVDTMFLAYKYDVGRKYISYGLKSIVKQENLEVKDRVFYDAGEIRKNYKDPVEFSKIKQYAIHDSDDSLALYDLMCPVFFYQSQYVPKSYQEVCLSASGSQLNAMMVRSYLQDGHSIPKATDKNAYQGAISRGESGIYNNCIRWDVNHLYPAIILTYDVYDKIKDPNKNLLSLTKYFIEERKKNKKLYKETKEEYYNNIQQVVKTCANSLYGFLGSQGLSFNSPDCASYITKTGREILTHAITWATSNE